MDQVRWDDRPKLRRPVMIAAFEGWNDAAESASAAVDYLGRRGTSAPSRRIDPEEFYDFTVVRPQVRLIDGVTREIDWRTTRFAVASSGRFEPRRRARARHRTQQPLAHVLRQHGRRRQGARRRAGPHARRARRPKCPTPATVQVTGTGSDPELIEQARPAPLALRRPDRHRRRAAHALRRGRHQVGVVVGRGPPLRQPAAVTEGHALAGAGARPTSSARRSSRPTSKSLSRRTNVRSTT